MALCTLLAGTVLLAACGAGAGDGGRGGGAPAEATGRAGTGDGPSAVAPQRPAPESTGSTGDGATAADRPRVVFLGTSLTAGLGLPPEQAYPALLQQRADSAGYRVTMVNAGLSGETSAGALRRAAWVLEQPAAVVVLEVGANDGLRGVDPDSTLANLVALVETVRRAQPSARVLLVQMEAPTNLGRDYTTRFRQAYVEAARRTGVPLLPFLLDGVAGVAALNQGDGIHPNAEGARRVAEGMWRRIEPAVVAVVERN